MSTYLKILLTPFLFFPMFASAATLSVVPENPLQGEPIRITVDIGTSTATVTNIYFESKKLGVFTWQGKPSALYGIDLYKKPAGYKVTAKLSDGTTLRHTVTVAARPKITAPLGIPEKLGGNTEAAATTLVSTLARENASLVGLRTGTHAFWTKPFSYPTATPFVTDQYGYSRQTGSYSIAHKGADFRASVGTPIFAMNRGVVRLVQEGRNYGKTIVIDHGLGLQIFYMHLSRIDVQEGELVLPGQKLGLSGMTGYAEEPHLHLTVRLYDISIDPLKFIAMWR